MRRIVSYDKFINEDAMAVGGDGGVAGMGAISNPTVSLTPGDVSGSISGSGDVSFPMNVDGQNIVYTNEPSPVAGFRKSKKDKVKPKKVNKKKKQKDISNIDLNTNIATTITRVDDFK